MLEEKPLYHVQENQLVEIEELQLAEDIYRNCCGLTQLS